MNRILYTGVCLLLGSAVLAGQPPLTAQEVIRIANAFAVKEGVCLHCYKRPVIRYHKTKVGNYWSAYYAPSPNRNGLPGVETPFSVRVDEANRTASEDTLR